MKELIEKPVREALKEINKKGILTNSSKKHGAPNYAYIEAKLNKKNLAIVKKYGFELDKIKGRNGKLLFNSSAKKYGEKTGYRFIGFNRKNLSDEQVIIKMKEMCSLIKSQKL